MEFSKHGLGKILKTSAIVVSLLGSAIPLSSLTMANELGEGIHDFPPLLSLRESDLAFLKGKVWGVYNSFQQVQETWTFLPLDPSLNSPWIVSGDGSYGVMIVTNAYGQRINLWRINPDGTLYIQETNNSFNLAILELSRDRFVVQRRSGGGNSTVNLRVVSSPERLTFGRN
jgi:hypothetical protein